MAKKRGVSYKGGFMFKKKTLLEENKELKEELLEVNKKYVALLEDRKTEHKSIRDLKRRVALLEEKTRKKK